MAAGGSWWTCSGAQAVCLSADAHAACLSADAHAMLEGWVAALGCADQLIFMC